MHQWAAMTAGCDAKGMHLSAQPAAGSVNPAYCLTVVVLGLHCIQMESTANPKSAKGAQKHGFATIGKNNEETIKAAGESGHDRRCIAF